MNSSLLLGSRNHARIEITRRAITGLPVRLITLDEVGVEGDAPEEGLTSAENAAYKAQFYYAAALMPTLAMDGALHIERFPAEKQPGVYVRRVNGTNTHVPDDELLGYYASELAAVGGQSPARWTASYALAVSKQEVIVHTINFDVLMMAQPVGQPRPGHALDTLMRRPGDLKPFSEMSVDEKPYFQDIRNFIESHLDRLVNP